MTCPKNDSISSALLPASATRRPSVSRWSTSRTGGFAAAAFGGRLVRTASISWVCAALAPVIPDAAPADVRPARSSKNQAPAVSTCASPAISTASARDACCRIASRSRSAKLSIVSRPCTDSRAPSLSKRGWPDISGAVCNWVADMFSSDHSGGRRVPWVAYRHDLGKRGLHCRLICVKAATPPICDA